MQININDNKKDTKLLSNNHKRTTFVDGIMPNNSNKTEYKKTSKVPTQKIQKSITLNRFAVKKPIRNTINNDSQTNTLIVKNKKPRDSTPAKIEKSTNIIRAAKAPVPHKVEPVNSNHQSSVFVPRKKTEDMIQAQLHNATAHLMTFKKPNLFHHTKKHLNGLSKAHRRLIMSSSVFALSVLLIGSIIYSNLPGISIMIASRRAGFTAYIPSFTPNGYKIKNPIGYTPGKVVINFVSNTNDFKYSIEQKPTGWTSDTLKEEVTSSNGSQYQTQYVNGLTVYFTGDDTATWVDRGILFTFQGNSGLSIDQIANVAGSM